jgi:hypothetical protein
MSTAPLRHATRRSWAAGAFAAVTLTLALLLLAGCSSSNSFVPQSTVTPGPLESNGPISWTEAASRVGEELTVQGPVTGTGSDGAGGVVLDVGATAPDPGRFVVVIPKAALKKFPKDPASFYDGQLLTATGLIEDRDGTATMVVESREDLTIGL